LASNDLTAAPPRPSLGRRLATFLYRRPRLQVGLLLAAPMGWLVIAYLGSLAVLFIAAFWRLDPFTAQVVHELSFDNFQTLWESHVYRTITARTVGIAAAVTLTDAIIAFPIAYYMARIASPRVRGLLLVAILMPLWSSYLVKVYAWRTMLQEGGLVNWALSPLGVKGPGFGAVATWLESGTHLPGRRPAARLPRGRRRVDLYVLAHARGLHHPAARLEYPVRRKRRVRQRRRCEQPPVRGGVRARAGRRDDRLPPRRTPPRSFRLPVMVESPLTRVALRVATGLTLAFIYLPLAVITLYAFNDRTNQAWPIHGLTLKWFGKALDNPGARDALLTSLKAGLGATALALVLGSLAAFAVQRYRFFGRETVSFLVILPIALPGIVTGMALNATFRSVFEPFGVGLGLFTVIVGHATFCIVVVYNNVVARLRRLSRSIEEASMDLGADTWQTFRYVTLPAIRTSLLAGALLAFALSFDEIIVTTFTAGDQQTLPIWIFTNLSRPNQLPIVNVVAVLVVLGSAIPVYIAQRLTTEAGVAAPAAAAAGARQ
jgi:putative spermidine/putrescine transport system permease protein